MDCASSFFYEKQKKIDTFRHVVDFRDQAC